MKVAISTDQHPIPKKCGVIHSHNIFMCLPVCRSFSPYEGLPASCHAVAFDFSGQYLAVGGPDVQIYNSKQVRGQSRFLPKMTEWLSREC